MRETVKSRLAAMVMLMAAAPVAIADVGVFKFKQSSSLMLMVHALRLTGGDYACSTNSCQ